MAKFSSIISELPTRASKIPDAQARSIFNNELKEDFLPGLRSNYEEAMSDVFEVDIDTSVSLTYALPSDFETPFEILDQNGNTLERGVLTSLDTDRNKIKLTGGNLIVDTNATMTKVIIRYWKHITDVSANDDEIPYATEIQTRLLKAWAKGIAFFYYRDKKKTNEVAFILSEVEDYKSNVFDFKII